MPDSCITEPQLAKRQRNLIFFSVAALMFGWVPTEMQASINMFGLQINKVDPNYMWSWGTAISCYLYFAWIITARDEDKWIQLRGGKLNDLWNFRDFYWLGWFTWRNKNPYSYSSITFGSDQVQNILLNTRIYNRKIISSKDYHTLFKTTSGVDGKDCLIDKEYFDKNVSRPWPFSNGYFVELHVGIYEGNKIYIMRADRNSSNRPSHVVTLKKELLLSVLPPLTLGALSIYTCLVKIEYIEPIILSFLSI